MPRRPLGLSVLLLLCLVQAGSQTLAHPGWRGNGLAPEAWWKHTAIVRFAEGTTFAEVEGKLNLLSEVGADSILLPDLKPTVDAPQPFDPRFGTGDDLDTLLREASARHMHVLLQAPLLRIAGNSGELRFWMSRGIAGLEVGKVGAPEMDTLHLLRTSIDHFPGQRVLIAQTESSEDPAHAHIAASQRAQRDALTLQLVSRHDAETQVVPPSSVLRAVELGSIAPGAIPSTQSFGGVPILDAVSLDTEDGRDQVRKMLSRRSKAVPRNHSRR